MSGFSPASGSRSTLTPEAKALLSATIRGLRARLLDDLLAQAEGDYRLSLTIDQARLPAAAARRRALLDAWIDERLRSAKTAPRAAASARADLLRAAVTEVAATWVNRLVLLKHLEAHGLSKPKVVTGGWNSQGYRDFRSFAPALGSRDPTEGYGLLLRLLFEEHALDLPGLFGEIGLERLFPLPPATLRELIEKLDDKGLDSAWQDDTTLGWVYQYWNDPERESLDKKISEGGKIEPGEIASKTQMFTERYMVEWLLQNTLGPTWLAICQKQGWQAEALAILPQLDTRRAAWRARREAGEVPLDALLPIEGELEEHWKYHVPQPLAPDAIQNAPPSIREVKLLDPACGSGHFLVIAFDLLASLYREEARHTGTEITDREVAESILENNLFGVDIDPRAIQIAAAALLLKARILSRGTARPARLNLVAPALKLGNLPATDPVVVHIKDALLRDCGIPLAASSKLFSALAGVDHLGTLLKIDRSIDEVIRDAGQQEDLFAERPAGRSRIASRESILGKLESFLATHTSEDDLGLKLDGEQLAQGVRFVRMVQENSYDIVVGNPPYQGTAKMADAAYVAAKYHEGKADLYAAFLLRSLQLTKPGGLSALLTMRGWMFLGQYSALRQQILHHSDVRLIGDVDRGAFDEVPNEVLAAAMLVTRKAAPSSDISIAIQPTPLQDKSYDRQRTNRKRAALLAQVGRYEFDTRGFAAIEGEPMVYWWGKDFLERYAVAPKLGEAANVRKGLCTCDDVRYVRFAWEPPKAQVKFVRVKSPGGPVESAWVPTIMGGKGQTWFEPLINVVRWEVSGIEIKVQQENDYQSISKHVRSPDKYFVPGIAFSMIGNSFSGRAHRYRSIFGNMGSSVFPEQSKIAETLAFMNQAAARFVLQSLNPGVHFEVGDVNRLPIFPVESADEIFATIDRAFTTHEAAREASVEYRYPGPSPWRYAQAWAQRAVDRAPGEPLPAYEEERDPPAPVAWVSHAFGVAMGRFSAEGIADKAPETALPAGILFLSARADTGSKDSLDHPACRPLLAAWAEHGSQVSKGEELRDYLRDGFFAHVKDTYENRPIYWPLSSAKKSFVAWVSIHRFHARWGEGTWGDGGTWGASALQTLLADHLVPERRAIEADLEELRRVRATGEGKAKKEAEKSFDKLRKLADELDDFLGKVAACADKGPPRIDKEPAREVDAPYAMDLDDGVMVNASALWPLLDPQWKDPKKWWKELASAQGRKDYDWSHLAARYFPARVEAKCVEDPSLAVAHGCFWRLHPAKAFAWELRLQDEIRPEFTLDEAGSDAARAAFGKQHPTQAQELRAKEKLRRERKADKQADPRAASELFEEEEAGEGE